MEKHLFCTIFVENSKRHMMKQPYKTDVTVLMLFFNRPDNFGKVFAEVKKARPSKLFLYQDGPRQGRNDMEGILACRELVKDENIDWQCEVHRHYCEKNQGCDPSEYLSQKWAFSIVDKCIVLEDDDVPSQSFFPFCKEMLDRYENDDRIWMISGFNVDEETPGCDNSYFFTSTFLIWGWASWRRVIDTWEGNYAFLDNKQAMHDLRLLCKERNIRHDFLPMCYDHRATGKEYYESIFWASMLLNSGLAIMPQKNLIRNIGLSDDSTHFAGSLKTTPKAYRKIFTMKAHELEFPLRHPKYIIEDVSFKDRHYRILAWNHPWIKVGRSIQEFLLNVRYGNFGAIWKAFGKRMQKWMGLSRHK